MQNETPKAGGRYGLVGAPAGLREELDQQWGSSGEVVTLSVENAMHHLRISDGLEALLVAWPLRDEARPAFERLVRAPRATMVPLVALCKAVEGQVEALERGADEAFVLPLCTGLLQARMKARARLVASSEAAWMHPSGPPVVQVGPFVLDDARQTATVQGAALNLTPKEFELIYHLALRAGSCCTRGEILNDVWGIDFDTGTNMIDVYVHFLRQKLKVHGLAGVIKTVRGRGYRFVVPSPGASSEISEEV